MDKGFLTYLTIFALCIGAALFAMRRREWSWIGLYIGLGCLLASMSRHETWIRMAFDPEVFLRPVEKPWLIPWTPSLPMGLLALLLGLVEFYAALGALRRPNTASTAALFVTALYQLASTAWAIGSWLFDGYGQVMTFGQEADFKLSQQLSLLLHTVLFDIPFVCAIPWGLSRSFQRRNTAADRILERFVLIVGIVLVILAVIASAVLVAGLRVSRLAGHGSFDAQLYVFASILVLTGLLVTAIVAFRRTFLSPAISIIESIHAERPVGEAVEPGSIWEPVVQSLDQSGTELRDARALLQSFVDNMPMALTVSDLSGKHLLVNPIAAQHHGAAAEHMTNIDPAANFAERPELERYLEQSHLVTKTKQSQVIEVTSRSAVDDTDKTVLVTFFPLFDSQGEVAQVGTIATDITELKASKAQAERARRAAEDARAMLQAFSDNVPAGLSIKDLGRNFTMINEFSARNYYAAKAKDLIGKNADGIRTTRHGDHLRAMEQQVLDTGKPQSREVAYEAVTGEQRHMHLLFFPILGEDGAITHIGSLTYDITEQRQAEAELKESQAVFEAIVNNLPAPLALLDPGGKILMMNQTAMSYYETPIEVLREIGPAESVKFWDESPETIQSFIGGVIVSGRGASIETRFIKRSGKKIPMLQSLFPIFGANGQISYVGGLGRDLSEEFEFREQLDRSRESLHQSEKLAALGQLLAGVSHELNNPLAAVIGQSSLLAEDLEGTEHADRVSKIRRAADRCARIVQSFLAMARQKAPEIRVVGINDLVRQAIELTEYQMRAANVLVDLQLAEALPAIEVDPDQMHQVIVNLLTNARQAMEENAGERRLTISTSQHRGLVKLRVTDNGKGIAPEARARIFDPFFSTKDVGSGTGIGLSYSLGIVEAHGGTLELEDEPAGTSFAITLPVAKGQVRAGDQDEGVSAQAQGSVLVIDDEADIADTLRDMLNRVGLNVTVALGGQAGLDALAAGAAFDLVVSDIRMPAVDGPAIHAWITAHRPDLLNRIVYMTGDTLGEHAASFLASVDCPVLEKPFSSAALRSLVERMLQQ